jgi:hypothetical protein
MPLSWNEIRGNAIKFSREFAEESREDAEAKSFWDQFFSTRTARTNFPSEQHTTRSGD